MVMCGAYDLICWDKKARWCGILNLLNCPDGMPFGRHLLELVCFNHYNNVTLGASGAVLLDWSWFLAYQNPKSEM